MGTDTVDAVRASHGGTARPRALLGVAAVILLLVGAASGWAIHTVFTPAQPPAPLAEYATVEVVQGDLGSALTVTASVTWPATPTGVNESQGVVTTVALEQGATVDSGAELYRVDDRPVTAAEGAIPAYRDLAMGASGADVTQLQTFLASQGYLDEGSVDGKFGQLTAAAVKRWQRDLGVSPTGSVGQGDLMFLPDLPARARLTDSVARAERLSGGEAVLEIYADAPRFEIPLNSGQADTVAEGMAVTIAGPNGDWSAQVDRVDELDDGTLVARLAPVDGDAICADECASVPVSGRVSYSATIEIVPAIDGLIVPAAALRTAADGSYELVASDGTSIGVDVDLQASGYAVITGVEAGTQVRVPAE